MKDNYNLNDLDDILNEFDTNSIDSDLEKLLNRLNLKSGKSEINKSKICSIINVAVIKKLKPFLILLLTIMLLISCFSYSYKKHKKYFNDSEKIAVQTIADISVALFYTNLLESSGDDHHIANFTDPELIQKQLYYILPIKNIPPTILNGNFQVPNSNYSIDICTDDQLNYFLIIARPKKSVWHTILPQKTVIVDSFNMQIRGVPDTDFWNTFTGALLNSVDIKNLETNISTIEPAQFDYLKVNPRIPRKDQLKLYNLPRYFTMSENIIKHYDAFKDHLQKYPELVLYIKDASYQGARNNHVKYKIADNEQVLSLITEVTEIEFQFQRLLKQHREILAPCIKKINGFLLQQNPFFIPNFQAEFLKLEKELFLLSEAQNSILVSQINAIEQTSNEKEFLEALDKFNLINFLEHSNARKEIDRIYLDLDDIKNDKKDIENESN